MGFVIQVCNPRIQSCIDVQVADVAQALQTVFPMVTEDAYLLWNGIPVNISYKYDLSVLIDDLLPLLDSLLSSDHGSYKVSWGSDTFMASWALDWADEEISIVSEWQSARGLENLLNSCNQIQIDHSSFLGEWKSILKKIIGSIEASGIVIRKKANLELLSKVERQIPKLGYLYSTP